MPFGPEIVTQTKREERKLKGQLQRILRYAQTQNHRPKLFALTHKFSREVSSSATEIYL